MIGNAASINELVRELIKAANKDAKIEALEKQVRDLIFERENSFQLNKVPGT